MRQKNKAWRLNGILNLVTSINAQGLEKSQLLPSLKGNIKGEINQGEIVGFNLQKQLQLAKIISQQNNSTQSSNEQFSKLSGSMVIVNGLGKTDDLVLTDSTVQINSQGHYNFINNSFDFILHSTLTAEKNSQLASFSKLFRRKYSFAINR